MMLRRDSLFLITYQIPSILNIVKFFGIGYSDPSHCTSYQD